MAQDEWIEGYPKETGWYVCLVDGEEEKLYHFICAMSGRHEWADKNNDYVYAEVKWKPPSLSGKF
jgi:exopolyphosphatase/pppGpp-phosphohydrolase